MSKFLTRLIGTMWFPITVLVVLMWIERNGISFYIPWMEIGVGILVLVLCLVLLAVISRQNRKKKEVRMNQRTRLQTPIYYMPYLPPNITSSNTQQQSPVWHNLPEDKYELLKD